MDLRPLKIGNEEEIRKTASRAKIAMDAKNKNFEPRNPKHETRNKFECSKMTKIQNNFKLDSGFWIFFGFGFI